MLRAAARCWLLLVSAAWAAPNEKVVTRGAYLAHLGGCFACHTAKGGTPLAGGLALNTPFGTLYTPNITPDRATGIGTWSQADFLRALHQGIRPDGSPLYPAFPYPSFAGMSDNDAIAIRAYLMAQPAAHVPNRANTLRFPYSWRPLLWVWRWLFFRPHAFHPDPKRDAAWNRGGYLVTAAAHCGECHTPRNFLGATIANRALSGTAHGPDNLSVPNITPDSATGIGGWSADDLVTLLTTGQTPEQDTVSGAMATAIADGLKDLSQQDARAIADYLLAQKPFVHRVKD